MTGVTLEGKRIVITGGSQGLGKGIAEYATQLGAAAIIICGRDESKGRIAASEIGRTGTPCEFVRADLQYENDCRGVIETAINTFGGIDGLVNAAGVTDRGTIDDTTVESWDYIMNVNARAPFILMQEFVRHARNRGGGGSIVNMISDNCHGGEPYLTAYASSKGALATLTKNVAHSVRYDRIRVNGICLGWTYTPHEHEVQIASGQPEDWLDVVEASKPFGRLLLPKDLAYLAGLLLSDQAEMMTGSLIDYDQKVIGAFGHIMEEQETAQ